MSDGANGDRSAAVRPRKILVVTNLYPGGVIPARGAFVANQVESLRALGLEVDVVALDGARSRWEYARGVVRMRRALRGSHHDLVHAHYGLTGLVARAQTSVPVVLSLIGSDLLGRAQRPWSRAAAAAADFCVVMTPQMRRIARVDHCVVIPNGTDLSRFRPVGARRARAALGWDAEEFVLLFPWNPARPEKDFALAAEAARRAQASSPQAGIRLVPFFGRSQEEYNLALNAADLCLLTSRHEGSPNAVREALAVGLPVVAVDAGDAQAMIDGIDHCIGTERDAGALAAAIENLARRRARSSGGEPLRHDGRRRVGRFSLEVTARKLIRLYALVLAGCRDGASAQREVDSVEGGSLTAVPRSGGHPEDDS